MSGPIHALVIWHGPRDHAAFAVASVIAEDMHTADDTALLSLEDLAHRARVGRTVAVRGVRILRDDGWLDYLPGGGRGVANRYRLRVSEAFATCSETCRHATGLVDMALGKPVAGRPEKAVNRSDSDQNRSPRDLSTVTVSEPSTARATEDALPGVLAAVSDLTETEAKTVDRVLSHTPAHARPKRTRHVVGLVVAASRGGHTAADICRWLDPPRIDYTKVGPGAVVAALAELAAIPAHPSRAAVPAPEPQPEPADVADPALVADALATMRAAVGRRAVPAADPEKRPTTNGKARPTPAERVAAAGARYETRSRRRTS